MTNPSPHPNTAGRARAVLLLSGGLDSSTLLALATRDGFAVHAMSFRYGQRHEQETDPARPAVEEVVG